MSPINDGDGEDVRCYGTGDNLVLGYTSPKSFLCNAGNKVYELH